MSEFKLELKGVTKAFPGVLALDDVQLSIRPGTVHALMGENGAGKSTLMKCLFGIYKMDTGEIRIDGERIEINSPNDANKHGIAMVHQELQPIPARTVGENMYEGRFPTKGFGPFRIVDHKKMYRDTRMWLDEVKMDFDEKAMLGSLSVGQMQSVEIAKAVSQQAKVVILDEPTSSLSDNEVETLFRIMNDLRDKGVSMIYISHKMDEIKRIAGDITIMRDGTYVGTWKANELTTDDIITKMVGRELTNVYPQKNHAIGEVVMEVKNFSSIHSNSFQNVSFQIRKGEILGFGGLVCALFGTITGSFIAFLNVPPFIATLAMMEIVYGINLIYTNATPLGGYTEKYTNVSNGRFLGINYLIWIAVAVALITWFIFNMTRHGKYMYAIGGVSVTGGRGKVTSALVGVAVFELLKAALQFLGVDANAQYIAIGIIIFIAISLDIRKYVVKK